MNISEIVSITPNGKPYESQYGLLYPFLVAFSDNRSGTVNTKTAQPPYKVGDRVGYDVTGDFKGVSKLKISKNPDKAFGSAPPQIQPPTQPRQTENQPALDAFDRQPSNQPSNRVPSGTRLGTEVEALSPVFGATAGMAMNQAIQALTAGLTHDEVVERITTPVFWYSVHEVASDIIRVARELEKGRLAPSPTERAKRAGVARNASAGHPDSHPDLEETGNHEPPF